MKKVIIILTVMLLLSGCTLMKNEELINENTKLAQESEVNQLTQDTTSFNEESFTQSFYGQWMLKDDNRYRMNITEDYIRVEMVNSELLSTSKYELYEVNQDENYIIVNITEVDKTSPSDAVDGIYIIETVNNFDKLTLSKEDIIYEYKYNDDLNKHISEWSKIANENNEIITNVDNNNSIENDEIITDLDNNNPVENNEIDNLRDKYLIFKDTEIIDFSTPPSDLVKIYDCEITIDDYGDRQFITLHFDGLEIDYLVQEIKGIVHQCMRGYKITSSLYKTEKGITFGSCKSEVQSTYDIFQIENEFELVTYQNNSEFGHRFIFNNEYKIKEILFGTFSRAYYDMNKTNLTQENANLTQENEEFIKEKHSTENQLINLESTLTKHSNDFISIVNHVENNILSNNDLLKKYYASEDITKLIENYMNELQLNNVQVCYDSYNYYSTDLMLKGVIKMGPWETQIDHWYFYYSNEKTIDLYMSDELEEILLNKLIEIDKEKVEKQLNLHALDSELEVECIVFIDRISVPTKPLSVSARCQKIIFLD